MREERALWSDTERSQALLDQNRRLTRGSLRAMSADHLVSTTAAISVFATDPTEWWTARAAIVNRPDARCPAQGDGDGAGGSFCIRSRAPSPWCDPPLRSPFAIPLLDPPPL